MPFYAPQQRQLSQSLSLKYAIVVSFAAAMLWSIYSLVQTHKMMTMTAATIATGTQDLVMNAAAVVAGTTSTSTPPVLPFNYSGPSTTFRKFQYEFPCFQGDGLMKTKPAHEGLFFHRPLKVGSTTMSGIMLRLAHNRSPFPKKECKFRANHGTALSYEFDKRDPKRSFVFSLIRDPTKRAVSQFFHFEVSVGQQEPTDAIFKKFLRHPAKKAYLPKRLDHEKIFCFGGSSGHVCE